MTIDRFVCVAALLCLGACDDDDVGVNAPGVPCPNVVPADGAACPSAGLVCNYFTGCETYYPATCGENLKWSFSDDCVIHHGGADAAGGTGGTGGADPVGGGGGAGGAGGTAGGGAGGTGGS